MRLTQNQPRRTRKPPIFLGIAAIWDLPPARAHLAPVGLRTHRNPSVHAGAGLRRRSSIGRRIFRTRLYMNSLKNGAGKKAPARTGLGGATSRYAGPDLANNLTNNNGISASCCGEETRRAALKFMESPAHVAKRRQDQSLRRYARRCSAPATPFGAAAARSILPPLPVTGTNSCLCEYRPREYRYACEPVETESVDGRRPSGAAVP